MPITARGDGRWCAGVITTTVALILAVLSGTAQAVVTFDGGPDGTGTDWFEAANWDPDTLPSTGDNRADIPGGFTVDVDAPATAGNQGNLGLRVGLSNNNLATLNILPGGSLTIDSGGIIRVGVSSGHQGQINAAGSIGFTGATNVILGDSGAGTWNQTAGSITNVNILSIGEMSTGVGALDFSGSTLGAGTIRVGQSGSGTFNVGAGTVSASTINFGNVASGTGTGTFSGGIVNTSNFTVGVSSTNTSSLLITGAAAVTTTGNFHVGDAANSKGVLEVAGGSLAVNTNLRVGQAGQGEIKLTGGQVTVNNMFVSNGNGSTGTATIAGGALSATAINVGSSATANGTVLMSGGVVNVTSIDLAVAGTGSWTQTGGTLNANGLFEISQGGVGDFNLSGAGVVNINNSLRLGVESTGSNASWTQTGGTLSVNGSATLIVGHLASAAASDFTLTAGQVTLHNGALTIGNSGNSNGDWIQSGGVLASVGAGSIVVGQNGAGTFSLSGGVVQTASSNVVLGNGGSGSGIWTQTGGTLSVGGALILGNPIGSVGTFNLSGGVVTTPHLDMDANGQSHFNLSGSGVLNVANWTIGGSEGDSVSLTGGTINTLPGNTLQLAITNDGSTLSPGGANVLGVANITGGSNDYVQNAGTLLIDIFSASAFDQLLMAGANQDAVFNGGGVSILINPGYALGTLAPGSTFDLALARTVSGIDPALLSLTFSDPHFAGVLSYHDLGGGTQSLRLTLTMVPEPGTIAVVLVGLAALQRRRSRAGR